MGCRRDRGLGRRLGLAATALVGGLLVPRAAAACDCAASTACRSVAHADAVFVGRVLSIADAPDGQWPARVVRFAVAESFIGGQAGEAVVRTGQGGGDCGFRFDVGTTYVIYAHRTDTGALSTGICSRTAKTALNGGELAMLRRLDRARGSIGRVSGQIHEERRDDNDRIQRAPLSGFGIEAIPEGGGAPVRSQTDAEGRFQLSLPPARYRIVAEPRSGLAAPDRPTFVNVFGGDACARVTLTLRREGG
jgi:hypothetical protein